MEFLKQLSEEFGTSGDENLIWNMIADFAREYCSEVFKDNMGNLYCFKKGTGENKKTIMMSSHTDEVGFIISSVTDEGFLKFRTVGGIDENVMLAKRVRIGKNRVLGVTGVKAVHLSTPEDREKRVSATDMYIDIGAKSKEDALKMVNIGDYAVFDTKFEKMGDLVKGKAFDDRLGCYILTELMKNQHHNDIWYCFTVQEEMGLRGASVASRRIKADAAIVVECTTCLDFSDGDKSKASTFVGKGPALTIVDRTTYADVDLRETLFKCAEKFQYKNVAMGGNDAGAIHLNNIKTAAVSIPARYIHSPVSVVSESDVNGCIKLLDSFLNKEEF